MKSVCLYFQVHQPYRLKKYSIFDIGKSHSYFDDVKNKAIMEKVAKKCYLPMNNLILKVIQESGGSFKASYSITGTALEQFQRYMPSVIRSFRSLSKTGSVEFLSETYYHSLSFLFSKEEFSSQVSMHKSRISRLFKYSPKVFRNTELIYYNELANFIEKMGYAAILAEGADHVLGWRSPNFVYKSKTTENLKLLLKNYKLSDDIAFRFSNRNWGEYPLTAEKFASWLEGVEGTNINLFMDYETFGEHQWEDTGIFNFMRQMPKELSKKGITFRTPSEIAQSQPIAELDIHHPVSWADLERDLSAWLGNKMQNSAASELYSLEKDIKSTRDKNIIGDWRKLTTSDHFYYMCTKWFSDGDVHKYFNPYDSPYECYISFMNILNDLAIRVNKRPISGTIPITENPSLLIKA